MDFAYSYSAFGVMEDVAEDVDTGGEANFRPRVPFGQDDFNQLLVQVMWILLPMLFDLKIIWKMI